MSGLIPLVSSSLSLMSVLAGSPQCLCPALSTEVNLSLSRESDTFHHHPLPAARPVGQNHRGQWVDIRGGSSLTLFKGVGPRMEPPESYSGVFWFIPPSWLGLSPANLLYREDFPQSVHLGSAWSHFRRSSQLGSENSAGRILVRNHHHSPYSRTVTV